MNKTMVLSAIGLVILFLSGCQQLDVVAKAAQTSFDEMAAAAAPVYNESAKTWEIRTGDGEMFSMADNFSGIDFIYTLKANPFIDAGLMAGKLPAGYRLDEAEGFLFITFDVGDKPFVGNTSSMENHFKAFLSAYRKNVGYHSEFDHYGIALGNGNMFEWAKDMAVNDKDIVLVLNPEPFITAGVDPAKIAGWKFAAVTITDEEGKRKVDKFLKPYNIE